MLYWRQVANIPNYPFLSSSLSSRQCFQYGHVGQKPPHFTRLVKTTHKSQYPNFFISVTNLYLFNNWYKVFYRVRRPATQPVNRCFFFLRQFDIFNRSHKKLFIRFMHSQSLPFICINWFFPSSQKSAAQLKCLIHNPHLQKD